jgi:hypothetical protein
MVVPAVAIVLLLTMGIFLVGPTPVAAAPSGAFQAGAAAPVARSHAAADARSVRAQAGSSSTNLPCYPLNATLCVSLASSTTPNIIPIPPNHNAPYMPNATDNITLYVKSEYNLQFPGDQPSGIKAPLAINVTGVLWNGDPYFCTCDDSTWHANSGTSNGGTWWSAPASLQGVNKTYPYYYVLQILPHNQFGQQQFFAGETVSWFVYVTSYNAKHTSTSGTQVGPTFTYRIAGAWPFSPWPGAVQYAGVNASTSDLIQHWSPLVPNWNDSIAMTIQLTGASVSNRTLIGFPSSAFIPYIRLTETLPNGTVIFDNATFLFPVVTGVTGASNLTVMLPPTLTQVAGSTIVFQIFVQDSARFETDAISLPVQQIIVNGNGTFATGVFADDLFLNTSVGGHGIAINYSTVYPPVMIGPGVNVSITVQTRSLSTSIQSAEVIYTFAYGPLNETVTSVLPMNRVNSTAFTVQIPGMPVDSNITFTVEALDYQHHLDISNPYAYGVQPLLVWDPAGVPLNETFFYVYVFNNQSQSYLAGAQVQIRGTTATAYNTLSSTRFGVAYPNATGNEYLPLFVPGNQTYNITVTPNPGTSVISAGHSVDVSFLAADVNAIGGEHRTIAKGSDYVVVQEGSSLYFWLNGTLSTTIVSPNQGTGWTTYVAAVIGLAGAACVSVVVWMWFRDVQARRKAEEKRVTL